LEGTENRIAVARNRYITAVQDYNVLTRRFPNNLTAMMFGYKVKPNFNVEDEQTISRPPAVSFDNAAPGAPAPAQPSTAPSAAGTSGSAGSPPTSGTQNSAPEAPANAPASEPQAPMSNAAPGLHPAQ
jgi:LemA protein